VSEQLIIILLVMILCACILYRGNRTDSSHMDKKIDNQEKRIDKLYQIIADLVREKKS